MRAPILNAVQFCHAGTSKTRRGFTIIELLATMSLIALLSALAVPHYSHLTERARVAKAIGDIQAMRSDILAQDSLPASLASINRQSLLDPWGHPYVFVRLAAANGAPGITGRTDKFGNPVNSTFDLYSLGKDGVSAQSFSAAASQDDVALGRDGGFIGLAQTF
jgi:general secretion pathway protein G